MHLLLYILIWIQSGSCIQSRQQTRIQVGLEKSDHQRANTSPAYVSIDTYSLARINGWKIHRKPFNSLPSQIIDEIKRTNANMDEVDFIFTSRYRDHPEGLRLYKTYLDDTHLVPISRLKKESTPNFGNSEKTAWKKFNRPRKKSDSQDRVSPGLNQPILKFRDPSQASILRSPSPLIDALDLQRLDYQRSRTLSDVDYLVGYADLDGLIASAKFDSIFDEDIIAGLAEFGVELKGDATKGFYLQGDIDPVTRIPRVIHIDMYYLNLNRARREQGYRYDRSKVEQIEKWFFDGIKKKGISNSKEDLETVYEYRHIFGAAPSIVRKIVPESIEEISSYIATKMEVPKKDLSNPKGEFLFVTTQGGGGHFVHSNSMSRFLEQYGYRIKTVYVESLITDPIAFLTAGRFTSNDRYNILIQKNRSITGKVFESKGEYKKAMGSFTRILYTLRALIGHQNNVEALTQILKDPRYILVIDSLPHYRGLQSAAISTGTPFIRAATDYDVWRALEQAFPQIHGDLGVIALTSKDPKANAKLSTRMQEARTEAEFTEALEGKAKVMGYPVRPEIRALNSETKMEIRAELGFSQNEQIITVMMGSQGKQELVDVVKAITTSNPKTKFQLIIGVGSNFAIKSKILEETADLYPKPIFADDLFGAQGQFLDGGQINQLLNISTLLVSKPGGSQSAEVLETRTPIYMYGLNSGEVENAAFLERSGLGVWHRQGDDLRSGILGALEFPPKLKDGVKVEDWRANLLKIIKEFGIPDPAQSGKEDATTPIIKPAPSKEPPPQAQSGKEDATTPIIIRPAPSREPPPQAQSGKEAHHRSKSPAGESDQEQ